ncbi:hypothetical protein [Cupriavidus sp. D384]|uniref:hypothetical protein n=1 Tax=Cupriavidus sp. D384 TaxID=1538095 RepID=UPI0027D88F9B|nr:hypothetical protein [Cupriavidus sp. D384]
MTSAAVLCCAILGAGAAAQPAQPRQGEMADSVVSRLVAWRARTDQPVALSALTAFDWDSFSVIRTPAGMAMANCNRDGFLPCSKDLQPSPDTLIQVLRFDRAGQPVYQERIMVASANFADPLPAAVPRPQATLVTCQGDQGQQLWCLQSKRPARQTSPALRGLDGG